MNLLRREWGLYRVLLAGALVGLLTPVRVYPDSVFYLKSGTSFFSDGFAENYWWVREPLYPMFLRVMLELPDAVSIHAVPIAQGIAMAAGFWLFAEAARGMGLLKHGEAASYYAMTCLFVSGYSGAVLQQTFMVFAAGALAFCSVRLATGPVNRRILILSAAAGTFAVLLSSIFLASVALLPFATILMRRQRFTWPPFAAIWGASALSMGAWMLIRVANGQPFGLGGSAVLERSSPTDWPLRIQAFLATFGVAPDFYDSVNFNLLSYSNRALGLNPYFGSTPCGADNLADLAPMSQSYLTICGTSGAPTFPESLVEALTTVALLQVLVGVVAIIWAWSATSNVRLYAFVLVVTAIPCLPVAFFLAYGNSRYGLPVLALSLVLTVGMASRAYERIRQRPVADALPR